MPEIIISDDNEVVTLQSVERITFAVSQFKNAIKQFEGDFSAVELELLLQPILTIYDANNNLAEVISQSTSRAAVTDIKHTEVAAA
ncbi:MAG: hypothetical protein ACI88H_001365 [Cocleimonas sp.]|jgi:hypothetical protein